jgi:hypothetical protein
VFGVKAPLCESIGAEGSTPLKARMAPVTADDAPSDQS